MSDMTRDESLSRILSRIHDERGLDFTQYKETMVLRRIASRMAKCGAGSHDEYLRIIETQPGELDELVRSLSINVTELFRNPESFNAINDIVVPRVIAAKRELRHKIIKAWSCGCSSGDEPYSLALLFLAKLGDAREKFMLTFIGSDIDQDALREAKNKLYGADGIRAVGDDIVKKYFEKTGEGRYQLRSQVSSMVRFRHHDVINDIPFMHCDVILCRNLLIYFNKQLQEETLLKFHDCLNPGGFLVLGMTESLSGNANQYFEAVDNRLRIYRRPEAEIAGERSPDEPLSQKEIDDIVKQMLEQ